ncbi:MAG TPA: hypothetical protein VJA21_15030 [Verrucomicrobiae bacterium]
MTSIKRFLRVNAAACAGIGAFWAAIAIADAKVDAPAILTQICHLSLLIWIAGLPILNAVAFRRAVDQTGWRATVAAAILALIFAYVGLIGIMELKIALGGHK